MAERHDRTGRLSGAVHNIVLLFLAGGMIAVCGPSEGDAGRRLDTLPLEGLSYRGRELPLTPIELELLGGAEACKRVYETAGRSFLIMVVDGSRNNHAVHDPIYCLRGRNFKIGKDIRVGLPNGSFRAVGLNRGQERKEIAYWFTDGEERHTSFLLQKWQAALVRVGLTEPRDYPLMVTIQSLHTENETDWNSVIDALPFLSQL